VADLLVRMTSVNQSESSYVGTSILFDSYYFDEQLKVEVFHKNSTTRTNRVGKAQFPLYKAEIGAPYTLEIKKKG